ncbi:hypothetical protein PG997_000695 [Apiospora hydei]|uniref:Transposase n=1 Tax=Apiospora hydei TaxID=1337664 RepID=A0ABR1XBE0_9PEZI
MQQETALRLEAVNKAVGNVRHRQISPSEITTITIVCIVGHPLALVALAHHNCRGPGRVQEEDARESA